MFKYIDVLSKLVCKSITESEAATLLADVKVALADMELHFPAWELTTNRHNVLHLAEAVCRCGPCWAYNTFPYERFWKRLIDWMTQTVQPAAVMMNAYRAFRACSETMVLTAHLGQEELGTAPGERQCPQVSKHDILIMIMHWPWPTCMGYEGRPDCTLIPHILHPQPLSQVKLSSLMRTFDRDLDRAILPAYVNTLQKPPPS